MTELIEVKTADLSGEALNWAVGKAERLDLLMAPPVYGNPWRVFVRYAGEVTTRDVRYAPQESWTDGGPLIDKYQLTVSSPLASVHRHGGPNAGWGPSNNWSACTWTKGVTGRRAIGHHETSALVAACRAIVAAKLGDTVQVPKELI
ncbi:hypothetical protein PMM47T1_14125 [Pseudomonas sp. M47T1]|uniref:phage protein NinX family protein n=1 Tax=Pseudomonas sp. M47T1 TaxID=1179778 RepID=UPI0002608845|nr:phage protein NinX family protein [Pseudomonas sp. M47T1]EIK96103.1 hypothetical protein PMM47T1_14125 [Pseudomonas sp. M47T1]